MFGRLLTIVLMTLAAVCFGLIAGGVIGSRQRSGQGSAQPSGGNKQVVQISRSFLLNDITLTTFFLAIGIISIAYGYGIGDLLWRFIGYLGVFFGFSFLGVLLGKLNI